METKICPKCGQHILAKSEKCPLCGVDLIDINKQTGPQLEQLAIRLFESGGQKVIVPNGSKLTADLLLYHENKLMGYVFVYKNLKGKNLLNTLQLCQKIIKNEKPKMVVFTNLISFYVKYEGKEFEKLYRAPTIYEYEFIKQALDEYFEYLKNNQEDKNNGNK